MLTNCRKPKCVLQRDLFGEQRDGSLIVWQGFTDPHGRPYVRVSRPGKTGARNELWLRGRRAARLQPDPE